MMTDHRAEEDLLGPELRAVLSTLPKEIPLLESKVR